MATDYISLSGVSISGNPTADPNAAFYPVAQTPIYGNPSTPSQPTGYTGQPNPNQPTQQQQSSAYGQAQANLTPTATPTQGDFFTQVQQQMQPVLDQINQATIASEQAATQGAAQVSTQQTGAMNVGQNARGLAGSTEGANQAANIEQQRSTTVSQAVAQAEQAKATAIGNLNQFIKQQSTTDFQNALTRNDTQSQAYIAQQNQQMMTSLSGLASSGHTLNDLQKTDANLYQSLLQQSGGSVDALNAKFVQASQANMIGDPIQVGNTLVWKMKALDSNGNPTIKTVDIAMPSLPAGYSTPQFFNQAGSGQVMYVSYPKGADGTPQLDPTKPNNGIMSGTIGGSPSTTSDTSTVPTSTDQVNQSILSQTGLSLPQFNFLTQGTAALSRMNANDRKKIMADTTDWLNSKGIDVSTFQSQYKTYNDVLSKNINRFNSTVIAENELKGTLTNLGTTISDADLGHITPANVADIYAGRKTDNPTAQKYAFQLSQLKNEVALYFAATQGKASPDVIDDQEAGDAIANGIGAGSVSGLTDAITQSTDKMKGVLQQSVDSSQKAVWDLFGAGSKYQPKSDTSSSTSDASSTSTSFAETW